MHFYRFVYGFSGGGHLLALFLPKIWTQRARRRWFFQCLPGVVTAARATGATHPLAIGNIVAKQRLCIYRCSSSVPQDESATLKLLEIKCLLFLIYIFLVADRVDDLKRLARYLRRF